jgi:hypothetical protein
MWKRMERSRWVSNRVVLGLLLALSLTGCAELSYKAGDLYGWNCRPEALQNGRCVPAR